MTNRTLIGAAIFASLSASAAANQAQTHKTEPWLDQVWLAVGPSYGFRHEHGLETSLCALSAEHDERVGFGLVYGRAPDPSVHYFEAEVLRAFDRHHDVALATIVGGAGTVWHAGHTVGWQVTAAANFSVFPFLYARYRQIKELDDMSLRPWEIGLMLKIPLKVYDAY